MRNRFRNGAAGTKNGRLFTRPARIIKEPMLSLSESMGFLGTSESIGCGAQLVFCPD